VDRLALEKLYMRHRQGLYTLALTLTGCEASAEDAVQEACARLLASREPPAGDPAAYLFAAVRNAAVDQRRRGGAALAARSAAASIFNGRRLASEGPEAARDAEADRRVREAVAALPEDQREALSMRVYGGLTFEQMAQACGEPLSTVSSRYGRAIGRLRQELRGLQ
jgi:RNA polymerase sigma-70 factor (ECF subfamily)